MREIKFRAQRVDNGEFVYGNFVDISEIVSSWFYIEFAQDGLRYRFLVNPETVGQFTGLHDNKGKEIFEGDILNYGNYRGSSNLNGKACNHIVKWDVDNACFSTKAIYESDTLFPLDSFAEIIGNIHEHNFLLDEK